MICRSVGGGGGGGGVSDHELLTGLLGGAANDHQHLTTTQLSWLGQDLRTTASPTFVGVFTTGNAGLGQSTFGTSATKTLAIGSGVAPSTSPADAAQLYVGDVNGTAGNAGFFMRTETGAIHSFGSKVGIGTASPSATLDIQGANTVNALNVRLTGENPYLAAFYNSAYSPTVSIFRYFGYNDGEFRMGTEGAKGVGIFTGDLYTAPSLYCGTGRNVGIGQTTFGTSSAKVLAISTGIAPTSSPADAIQMYSADQAAGNAVPHFRTENGSVIKLYKAPALTVSDGTLPNAVTRQGEIETILKNFGLLT